MYCTFLLNAKVCRANPPMNHCKVSAGRPPNSFACRQGAKNMRMVHPPLTVTDALMATLSNDTQTWHVPQNIYFLRTNHNCKCV